MQLVLLYSLLQTGAATPYTLPITRKGKTKTMVAAEWWSGEYPTPVIDVRSKDPTTGVYGYASPRVLAEKTKCTIPVGIYHPWSKDSIHVETYYTILAHRQYEVTKSNAELDLRRGDRLALEVNLGENMCSYVRVSGETRMPIYLSCDLSDIEKMRQIKTPAHPSEQWLYVKCNEGHKIFIQDEELLRQTGNKKGKICGYGVVASEGQDCPVSE